MSELWVPSGVSVDDFVVRIHSRIADFARRHKVERPLVEVELRDGSRFALDAIEPDPGYGFVTIAPHPEEGEPAEELIVPLASISRIRISQPDDLETPFGFGPRDDAS